MKDLTVSRPFSEEEYNALLQQAVAVIESSRLQIAKQLNTIAISSYWELNANLRVSTAIASSNDYLSI